MQTRPAADGCKNKADVISRSTRLGTRVRFIGHSFAYTNPPAKGEEGEVTYMPGYKPRTYLPGPGGGLLYVKWDRKGVMGVSPKDLDIVRSERDIIAPHLPPPRLGTPDEVPAIDALKRYRGQQPRSWVKGQLLRNRWSDVDAETLLRKHFDPKGLGESDEFPRVSLTYGTLPNKKLVLERVGKLYPVELVSSDFEAVEECLLIIERRFAGKHDPFEEFSAPHGKYGYRFTPEGLYALLECIVERYDEAFDVSDEERGYGPRRSEAREKAERALDLASAILDTLDIEWV